MDFWRNFSQSRMPFLGDSLRARKQYNQIATQMHADIKEILFTADKIKARVKELGRRISAGYRGKPLALVGILNGVRPFLNDLLDAIDLPVSHDLIELSSYGRATVFSGTVRILRELAIDISGRDVMLVEDIIDTGLTLHTAIERLRAHKPATLKTCTLLNKQTRRSKVITPDYCGFIIPDLFVVGYGLDYAEKYRELPYIGALKINK